MHRYEVIIYWSAEDSAYVAEVPELPGCMAHGPSHEVRCNPFRTQSRSGSRRLRSSAIRSRRPKGGDSSWHRPNGANFAPEFLYERLRVPTQPGGCR